ncbi:hypothetical protein FQN52_005970 [Onygenales sp. PD_12]|nr:hypothetical protein FQN52_005970 [Onygenales sp. PD_12]
MKFSTLGVAALISLVAGNEWPGEGHRKVHHVDVGTFDGEVKFIPNQITAPPGDLVAFNFLAQSHSLTQSEFNTPCTYNGGFDTGLNQLNPKNESGKFVYAIPVTTEKPLWFYCKQQGPPNHCGKGMVFGLNPGDKMDQFIKNAIAQNGGLNPAQPTVTQLPKAAPTVTVGLDKGKTLRYSPDFMPDVPKGTKIHFDFRAANHTLTESSWEHPCTPLKKQGAVDTGFNHANPNDIPESRPFDLLNDSNGPRYFYCKQAAGTPNAHCAKGMVFAINVSQWQFKEFQKRAIATAPKIKGRSPM